MAEEIKRKKIKRPLTRKEAIRKGNKDFRLMARQLAKTMNSPDFKESEKK